MRTAAGKLRLCLLSLWAAGHTTLAADGFATIDGNTTGGAGGPIVTVGTGADFRAFATSAIPVLIQVRGTIDLGATTVKVRSNKTIFGTGYRPGVIGELSIDGETNVILHNLFIENNAHVGDGDGVRLIGGAHHVWVDHCTFTDCADGSVDITQGSDLVTVSWCKFNYTRDNGHNFVNLIGANDSDFGSYRLTYHHNWWSTLCMQRMPSQRFGQCHVYNSYFNCVSNQHCTAV
jgi:pectate lyase